MDYHQLLEDIKYSEKDTAEFKASFSDMHAIGRTLASFSTVKGGKIYVGVDDSGHPVGVMFGKDIKDKLLNLARAVNPVAAISVNSVIHDSKRGLHVVVIKVEKGGCLCLLRHSL